MDILESESVNKVNKVMKRDVLGNMAPSKGMLGYLMDKDRRFLKLEKEIYRYGDVRIVQMDFYWTKYACVY